MYPTHTRFFTSTSSGQEMSLSIKRRPRGGYRIKITYADGRREKLVLDDATFDMLRTALVSYPTTFSE